MSALFKKLKQKFYFTAASYFQHFAAIALKRARPTIIMITGSSGKTTFLHLAQAQFGDDAVYSHGANSAFGIPFHILGLKRVTYSLCEWPILFLKAPWQAYRRIMPSQKYYIVEADAERPREAESIAALLKPDIVVWLSLGQAHGASYDKLVENGAFPTVFDAIAFEYGYAVAQAKSLVIGNADNEFISKQLARTPVKKILVSKKDFGKYMPTYEAGKAQTHFEIAKTGYTIPAFLPPDSAYTVAALAALCAHLDRPIDASWSKLVMPPSRSSVFEGKKHTVLVDSTYNATIEGMKTMFEAFEAFPGERKWLVLGDMLEQGKHEGEEHEKLARMAVSSKAERILLVGPRLAKYTFPILSSAVGGNRIISFLTPAEAYEYIDKHLIGGETILFKGARFLEGVVEKLLVHPEDASKLCRREAVWVARRKKWGV